MISNSVQGLLLATVLGIFSRHNFQGSRNYFPPNSPMESMAHSMSPVICSKAILYKWCLPAYIFYDHLEASILQGTHFAFTLGSFFITIKQKLPYQPGWDKRDCLASIASGRWWQYPIYFKNKLQTSHRWFPSHTEWHSRQCVSHNSHLWLII